MSKTYSFLDIQATLVGPGGAVILGSGSGAADEGITITPTGDLDTMTIGADGTGQHSLSADKSGRITIRLLKTSPTNQILSQLIAFQRSGGASHGQNTLVINDSARGDVITCRQVAFAKQPAISYGKEAGMNEWEFNAVTIDFVLAS